MRSLFLSAALTALCAGAAQAQILGINELYYDATGNDDGKTFIELFGPPGFPIGGFIVRSLEGDTLQTPEISCGNPNQTGDIVLPAHAVIGPDGLYVIADTTGLVTQVVVHPSHNGGQPDHLVANADFENGPNEAVQLLDPFGSLIDALAIGMPTCTVDVFGLPMGFGTPAPDVFGGFSLTRYPQGNHTFDNAADFYVQGKPSPGASTTPVSLVFSSSPISVAAGGSTEFAIDFPTQPGAQYLLLASVTPPSGSDPLGVPFDPITNTFINLAATPNPFVVNFIGNLDASGHATAVLNIPPGVITLPFDVEFFFAALSPVNQNGATTNTARIVLTP